MLPWPVKNSVALGEELPSPFSISFSISLSISFSVSINNFKVFFAPRFFNFLFTYDFQGVLLLSLNALPLLS